MCEINNENFNGEPYGEISGYRFPELMNRDELAKFLRLDLVSKASNIKNVIDNLQRMRDLPVVHICRQPLYWLPAIRDWLKRQAEEGR